MRLLRIRTALDHRSSDGTVAVYEDDGTVVAPSTDDDSGGSDRARGSKGGDDDHDSINFELVTINGQAPPFAILSHTWDSDPDNEFLFDDARNGTGQSKPGYQKVKRFLAVVRERHPRLEYAWVDTCCIDKSSSAELSESINSMFRWYQDAQVCLVHLVGFEGRFCRLPMDGIKTQLNKCRWFRRGWTLQELLAPRDVVFYSEDWRYVGTRASLDDAISKITKIHPRALTGDVNIMRSFNIAQRMSWAALRETTRPEDIAYCLLGIFDVNMPLVYGSGHKAFIQLQEEIIKESDDQTILCWKRSRWAAGEYSAPGLDPDPPHTRFMFPTPLLAQSPRDFEDSSHYIPVRTGKAHPYQLTNAGLRIAGRLQERDDGTHRILLHCRSERAALSHQCLKLVLNKLGPGSNQFVRCSRDLRVAFDDNSPEQEIYICKEPPSYCPEQCAEQRGEIELVDAQLFGADGKLTVLEVYPPSRWDPVRRIFSQPDYSTGSLTGFSWHVVVKFHVEIAGLTTSCIASLGYNGWQRVAWCGLNEVTTDHSLADRLDELWDMSGYRQISQNQVSTVVMEGLSGIKLRCKMTEVHLSVSSDRSEEWPMRWKMTLKIVE